MVEANNYNPFEHLLDEDEPREVSDVGAVALAGDRVDDSDEIVELELRSGHLSEVTLGQQREVVLALKKAHQRVRDLPDEGVAPVREELCRILEARKIQADDPFWALVDLFALVFERFGDRTNEVVASAVGVTDQRLKLDEQMLDVIPHLAGLHERATAASETCTTHVEALREDLKTHREELGQFVAGVAAAFGEFRKASDRVVTTGEHALISQVAIPLVALLAGAIAGYVLGHR